MAACCISTMKYSPKVESDTIKICLMVNDHFFHDNIYISVEDTHKTLYTPVLLLRNF